MVAHFLRRSAVDWLLFIDADIAVVNPNHLLGSGHGRRSQYLFYGIAEDYLPADPAVDVVLYDRIYNFEIAAGAYFVRCAGPERKSLK